MQEERAKLFILRRKHMLQQMTCQNVYYAWRTYSELYPTKYLCIIHDKMDQKKTCIPRVNPIPKSLNQVMPLPMSLTGMLTHGHGQNAYGHFALGFWPSDPNFTIGSLSKCFRNLERLDNHMWRFEACVYLVKKFKSCIGYSYVFTHFGEAYGYQS